MQAYVGKEDMTACMATLPATEERIVFGNRDDRLTA